MRDDAEWMRYAIDLSRRCPPSRTAFSVGAVVVSADGAELSTGFSRDGDPHVHAEESALAKVASVPLAGATLYSTLEPCTRRSSRPLPCTQLILAAGIPRVVIAWREPSLLVPDCEGVEMLSAAGVTVVELAEFAAAARSVNAHLG